VNRGATIVFALARMVHGRYPRSAGAVDLHVFATECKCATNARQDALRCCGEDEGRSLGAAFQREASNRPLLLRSKGVVVSEWEKSRRDRDRYVSRR
jgi:hypothetical protein